MAVYLALLDMVPRPPADRAGAYPAEGRLQQPPASADDRQLDVGRQGSRVMDPLPGGLVEAVALVPRIQVAVPARERTTRYVDSEAVAWEETLLVDHRSISCLRQSSASALTLMMPSQILNERPSG
jgi:hypothetical protein